MGCFDAVVRGSSSLGLAALAAVAIAATARAQDRAWESIGDLSYGEYGTSTYQLGDLDGDGVPEFAVERRMSGIVRIVSGASGTKITDLSGNYAVHRFADVNGDGIEDFFHYDGTINYFPYHSNHVMSGATLTNLYSYYATGGVGVGDADGDSIDDFVTTTNAGPGTPSDLQLRSGKDGSLLLTSAPIGRSAGFGYSPVALGDWNLDGFPDVAVADRAPPGGLGSIVIVSLQDGSVLATGGPSGNSLSWTTSSLSSYGDVDQDGADDFLMWNIHETVAGKADAGVVWIVSSRTLTELARLEGSDLGEHLHVASVHGDVDGDGVRDFALGKDRYLSAPIDLFSGRTLRRLYRIQPVPRYDFLVSCDCDADLDGDGLCDLVVGRPYAFGIPGSAIYRPGRATAERGRTAFLCPDPGVKLRPSGNPWKSIASTAFDFHFADFQPRTRVRLFHVETDGVAITPPRLLADRRTDANGEFEFMDFFPPTSKYASRFGVQAVGTDHRGNAVTTAIERFGYE